AGAAVLGPVDGAIRVADEDLTIGAVDGVGDAVPVEVGEQLLAAVLEQDVLVHAVVVPLIVRGHLVGPDHRAVIRLPREHGHRPLVVARPLVRIPGARVTDAVVEVVEFGIVAVPAPRGPAAALPLVALPGRNAEVLALHGRIVRVRVALDEDFVVRARAVPGPDMLAGVGVEGRDAAAHAELTTGDARDH